MNKISEAIEEMLTKFLDCFDDFDYFDFYSILLWIISILSGGFAILILYNMLITKSYNDDALLLALVCFLSFWFNPIIRIKINTLLQKVFFRQEDSTEGNKIAIGFIKFFFFMFIWISFGTAMNDVAPSKHSNYSSEQQTTINTVEPAKPTISERDKIALAQVQCKEEIKAQAVDPSSVKINWRYYNGKVDSWISGKSVIIYGDFSGTNYHGARVQQNFACEVIEDEENDKIYVNDLHID